MSALPSARLPKFRRIFTGGTLLFASFAALSSSASFAQTSPQLAAVSPVRVQRTISDDSALDQTLVASLPTPHVVAAVAAPAKPTPVGGPGQYEGELQIASIGPAMRPLVREFNAIWPTRGEITTYFGEVGQFSPRGHSGIDVAGPSGTPILAMDDGEVLKAYWNEDGYGGLVIIGHPSGYETWYGHLARFDVEKGDQVKRGQRIGLMGSTGYSTGPHLHFEVREDGQLRDPLMFLTEANLKPADW